MEIKTDALVRNLRFIAEDLDGLVKMTIHQAADRLESLSRAKEPVSSNEPLLARLDKLVDSFGESFFEQNRAACVLEAIEAIKSGSQAKEVPEGSCTVRLAVVAADGQVEARWVEEHTGSDGTTEIADIISGYDLTPLAAGIVEMTLPQFKIPTIQAEVVEVPK